MAFEDPTRSRPKPNGLRELCTVMSYQSLPAISCQTTLVFVVEFVSVFCFLVKIQTVIPPDTCYLRYSTSSIKLSTWESRELTRKDRAIRPCHPSHSMPLALILPRVCVCVCIFIILHIEKDKTPNHDSVVLVQDDRMGFHICIVGY